MKNNSQYEYDFTSVALFCALPRQSRSFILYLTGNIESN